MRPGETVARARLGARGTLGTGLRALLIIAILASGALFLSGLIQTQGHRVFFDFHGGLYNAGVDILHGHDPYRAAFLAHQAALMRAGGIALGETSHNAFSVPVYPAPANLAVVPLSLLPFWLAAAVFTVLSTAAMIYGLRLLGVRDWRCFALALTSWPFLFSLDLGALGPLLVLGAGIAWRWRDRLWPPALALATIVVAKLFPWPLGVWLVVTRRWRTLALATALGLAVTFVAWALMGFDGMAQYPRMLSNLSLIEEGRAVSLVAVLLAVGIPAGVAKIAALAVTAGMFGVAWRWARGPHGDARAFGLAVIAALTASPIVWEHYMVLLFVPIALVSPRVSSLWLLPLCTPLLMVLSDVMVPMGGSIDGVNHDSVRAAVAWLVLEGIVTWRLFRLGRPVRSFSRWTPSRPVWMGSRLGSPA